MDGYWLFLSFYMRLTISLLLGNGKMALTRRFAAFCAPPSQIRGHMDTRPHAHRIGWSVDLTKLHTTAQ